jgi:hypothetical protein
MQAACGIASFDVAPGASCRGVESGQVGALQKRPPVRWVVVIMRNLTGIFTKQKNDDVV